MPAGTRFTIAIGSAVGTETSAIGDPLTARLEVPLVGTDGAVLVPRGAELRGRVSRVQRDETPVLALELETIETAHGPVPVSTKLAGAQQLTILDTNERYDPDFATDVDALFYAPSAVSPAAYVSPPTYVGRVDFYDAGTRSIRLDRGSTVQVVLTKPLVVHGTP